MVAPGAGGFSAISRRDFLRIGGGTAFALAAGGSLAGCAARRHYRELARGERPQVLSVPELGILAAIAARVIAPPPGGPTAAETRVARRIDRELSFADERLVAQVRAALWVLEWAPLAELRLRRFTRLPAEAQDEFLQGCLVSSWRLRRDAFLGLRFLCLFFHYTDDRTWPSIGYGGPWVPRKLPEAANAIEVLDGPSRP